MAILTSLKLISAKQKSNSPTIQRRNKLLKQLHQQIELAKAIAEGRTYAPTKIKSVVNKESGERETVESVKRVKQWWVNCENGKLNLFVRYGAKILPLGKNVNAIELNSTAELIDALQTIHSAIDAGEMDTAIEAASVATRKQFK